MESSIFVRISGYPLSCLSCNQVSTVEDIAKACRVHDSFVLAHGKVQDDHAKLVPGTLYTISPRLRGGKGGFGSMLRAIGAQIEKTTNREACRDLSGRRMRDVNNEKKMLDYIAKKAEKEKEREKKKMEKLEKLTQAPRHFFNDPEYETKLHEAVENVDKALEKGLKSHSNKRKIEGKDTKEEEPALKKGLWLGLEDVSDSDSDSDEEEDVSMQLAASQSRETPKDSEAGASSSQNGKDEDVKADNGDQGSSSSPALLLSASSPSTKVQEESHPKVEEVSFEPSDEIASNQEATEKENKQNEATNSKDAKEDESAQNPSLTLNTIAAVEDITMAESATENSRKNNVISETQEVEIESINSDATELKTDEKGQGENKESDTHNTDLSQLNSVEELEALGLNVLKDELMKRGVKCGGTLTERAQRLLIVKDLSPDEIDPNLLAKKTKKKSKNQK